MTTPSFPTQWMLAVSSLIPVAGFLAPAGPTPTSSEAPKASEVAPAEPEASEPVPIGEEMLAPLAPATPPLSGKRVLVVGDSHTAGTFGRSLDLLLRTLPGAEVTTVGSCGLSPDGFLEEKGTRCGYLEIDGQDFAFKKRSRTPHIDDLLARSRPDLTIVELGANQIHSAVSDPRSAAKQIRALASRVLATGSRCLWVGPPYGTPDKKPFDRLDHIYTVLEEALPAGCSFVDSRPGAMPFLDFVAIGERSGRRGDGKHFDTMGIFGQHAARQWARAVFDEARLLMAQADEPPMAGLPSLALSPTAWAMNR